MPDLAKSLKRAGEDPAITTTAPHASPSPARSPALRRQLRRAAGRHYRVDQVGGHHVRQQAPAHVRGRHGAAVGEQGRARVRRQLAPLARTRSNAPGLSFLCCAQGTQPEATRFGGIDDIRVSANPCGERGARAQPGPSSSPPLQAGMPVPLSARALRHPLSRSHASRSPATLSGCVYIMDLDATFTGTNMSALTCGIPSQVSPSLTHSPLGRPPAAHTPHCGRQACCLQRRRQAWLDTGLPAFACRASSLAPT
jgi:hypothetical protein